MSRQYHDLKCETEYYQAVDNGKKLFEVRKNDRNFQDGDFIWLHEVVNGIPTGKKIGPAKITYILKGPQFGIAEGYCVMQLEGRAA
jgi:ParB family transcriptional regulator, chromosome partitioning protein